MSLRICLFGTFEVWREGQFIQDWKREKTKTLFKILLCDPGRVFSQDELIEYLWPDLDPKSAASNLRSRVGELRHVLEPYLQKGSQSKYIVTRHQGYCFQRHPDDWLDVAELNYLYEAGCQAEGQGNWAKAVSLYQSAASLYRGPYLVEDLYEEWAIAPRQKWQVLYLDILSHLAECHARLGQYRRAIARCREILRHEKYRESTYRQLMLYSYLAGHHGEALRTYQECHTALAELSTQPEPATQKLHEQILQRHIPGIDQVYQAPPVLRHEIPYTLSPGSVPFVGRQAEYARLIEYMEQARKKHGGCVLLNGEAGIGKTRLAQESLAYAHQQFKGLVLRGQSYELGLHAAYQPWVEVVREGLESLKYDDLQVIPSLWLAEVAKLVPELRARVPDLPENPPLPPEHAQLRFFEGLTQFLLSLVGVNGRSFLLLFLDDMHWADSSSLEFLNYFLPRLKEQPILIVGTYRSEEVPEGAPLQKLIQTWRPKGLVHALSLERLKASEVERLLKELPLKLRRTDVFSQRLYKETEGNPLFLIATLQHLFEEGALRVEGDAWVTDIEDISTNYKELMIPPTVKDLIAQRVARLSESERKLLQLASVIGHDFEFSLLERAWEGNGESLTALERLTKAHLLVEHRGRYEFSHGKIREVVYEKISLPLRQLLHQRVLHGLEQLHGGRREDWAGELAHHAYRAGAWKQALEYALQALKKAVREFRRHDGLQLAELGLDAALKLETTGADSVYANVSRFELLAQRAVIYDLEGRRREQEQDLTQIEELAERLQDQDRRAMALESKSGLYLETGRYAEAKELARKALALYKELGNRRGEGGTLHNIGLVCANLGQYEEALNFHQQALAIFREIGEQAGHVLNSLAVVSSIQGHYEEALNYYQQALEISERAGNKKAQVVGLNNIGIIHENMGKYEEALSCYQQALELCQQIGYHQAQWACLNSMGNVCGALERYEEALHYHHQALEISREIQDQRGQAYSLYNICDIHCKLGKYAEVLKYCEPARVIFQELGAKAEELLALSTEGLAHAQLNEYGKALNCSSQAVQILEGGQHYEYPHEIYFNHFQVLSALDRGAEALAYLQKAYDEVMRRAEKIKSDDQRRSFLENVKLNREILQAYQDRAS
jgi:predicted ATPase/DNA-binding SARP family transcriptional activator